MKVFAFLALFLFIPTCFADILEFYVTKDHYKVEVTREGTKYYFKDQLCSEKNLKGMLRKETQIILNDQAEIKQDTEETGIYLTTSERLTIGEDRFMNPIYVYTFSVMVNAVVVIDSKESSILPDLLNEAKKYCR